MSDRPRVETLAKFSAKVLAGTRDEFMKQHSVPILVQMTEPDSAKPGQPTQKFGTLMMKKEDFVHDDLRMFVHELLKAERANAFGMMITVGRAPNNDIVLPYEGISKFHAYFTKAPDGSWTLTDARSTNGTFLEGKRLAAEAKEKLDLRRSLDISFAEAIKCQLYSPEIFWNFAQAAAKMSKPRPPES